MWGLRAPAAFTKVEQDATVAFDKVPAVACLVFKDCLKHVKFVVNKMRETELARGSALALWPINVSDKGNVFSEAACDLAEVTRFVQPLLHSTLHIPTWPDFANQEYVLFAKDLNYLADCVKGTGSLPRGVPLS